MEEPGRLQSMGSRRVGHDWVTSFALFTFMHWRRKWQPTPVLLPGESQGQGSLVGCCLWGHTELDMTEVTYQQQQQYYFPFFPFFFFAIITYSINTAISFSFLCPLFLVIDCEHPKDFFDIWSLHIFLGPMETWCIEHGSNEWMKWTMCLRMCIWIRSFKCRNNNL